MPQPLDFLAAQPAMTAAAGAGSDRKNLVVIFLAGGSCAHNTLIPRTGANRTHYTSVRPGLAIADNPATALNADWQFHPALTGFKTLWDADRLAVIRNIGPLVVPVTRAQFLARSIAIPAQLYSHSDQQDLWETGIGNQPVAETGWIGRLAELLTPFNTTSDVSPLMSLAGPTDTYRSFDLRPLSLSSAGFSNRDGGFRFAPEMLNLLETTLQNYNSPNLLEQEYIESHRRAVIASSIINGARDAAANPTNIPVGPLGSGMRLVMRLASQQTTLEQRRSIFFLVQGGYDHHASQLTEEAARFAELNTIITEAYNATVTYGNASNTTFVIYSEFGRSLRQNGSGSDHGWGGHAFVFGGAVNGGFYGNSYSLDPNGPDLVESQCHMIPSTPTDTLIASLASWMGVPDATSNGVNPMNLLVPNLPNFPVRNLNLFN